MIAATVQPDARTAGSASATLIGLGAIGTFSAGHLVRLPVLRRLTLIDRDVYEDKNLASQDITPEAIGKPKALVQAERLRRINPALHVDAVVDDVEHVPLGLLRADLMVACLDSRRARQYANQVAWRLGLPWVDAGVHADQLLARVNVYVPGVDQPCIECAWSPQDYELIEAVYACRGEAPTPAATNAPASLGGLAAALQVIECQKILAGQWAQVAVAKQVLVNAAAHKHFVTSFRRNPQCRFDHATWQIARLDRSPSTLSIGDALSLAGDGAALRVEGQVFVKALTCPRCGESRKFGWQLSGRLGTAQDCEACRRRMLAASADAAEWLRETDLAPNARSHPLRAFGFRGGDVFSLRGGGVQHYQLATER